MSQYIGKIFWLNRERGFAFISHDGGEDVYYHLPSIHAMHALGSVHPSALAEGDEVQFDIREGDEGPEAERVKLLERKLPTLPATHDLRRPIAA